jgi:hypothetical protein
MKRKLITVLLMVFTASLINAQQSQEELSAAAANPLADLMSFPFQNNLNMNNGPYNRNVNILNIQPVIPLAGGKLITRTIFPIVRIPDFSTESGKLSSGLSDIVFTAFYVPESKGAMWGFGPIVELPTGGSIRGTQKWSAGPSLVVLVQPGDWTFGGLINNAWSFAGKSDRGDVNHMMLNIFLVGAGGGKLVMLGGKLPLNLQTQLYYNVVRPDFGPEWQWRVQAQILLPTSIFKSGN